MSINTCTVSGKLGRDPEYRETKTGKGFCSGSIAVSDSYKDKDGSWKNKTTWIRFILWGGGAKIFSKWKKGDEVAISGKLEENSWKTKDGQERKDIQINVREFTMPPKDAPSSGGGGFDSMRDSFDGGPATEMDDSIPF